MGSEEGGQASLAPALGREPSPSARPVEQHRPPAPPPVLGRLRKRLLVKTELALGGRQNAAGTGLSAEYILLSH